MNENPLIKKNLTLSKQCIDIVDIMLSGTGQTENMCCQTALTYCTIINHSNCTHILYDYKLQYCLSYIIKNNIIRTYKYPQYLPIIISRNSHKTNNR